MTSNSNGYVPHSEQSIVFCPKCGGEKFRCWPQSMPLEGDWTVEYTCTKCGWIVGINEERPARIEIKQENDPVNHPSHYCQNGIETIDVIEAWELNYRLGNAVKYISRAGKKDPDKTVQDLEKARYYLDREINKLKSKKP